MCVWGFGFRVLFGLFRSRSGAVAMACTSLRSAVEGRVAITGASQGIGARLAERLAASGARVPLVARSRPRLEEVLRHIWGAGVVGAGAPLPLRGRDRGHGAGSTSPPVGAEERHLARGPCL